MYEIRLRAIRRQKHMTLVELAEVSGIGKSTLSDIETGRHDPRLSTLVILCKTIKCTLDDLVIM